MDALSIFGINLILVAIWLRMGEIDYRFKQIATALDDIADALDRAYPKEDQGHD